MIEEPVVIDEFRFGDVNYAWRLLPKKPSMLELIGPHGKVMVSVDRQSGRDGHSVSYVRAGTDEVLGFNLKSVAMTALGISQSDDEDDEGADLVEDMPPPGQAENPQDARKVLDFFAAHTSIFAEDLPAPESVEVAVTNRVRATADRLFELIETMRPEIEEALIRTVTNYSEKVPKEKQSIDLRVVLQQVRFHLETDSFEGQVGAEFLVRLLLSHAIYAKLDHELKHT